MNSGHESFSLPDRDSTGIDSGRQHLESGNIDYDSDESVMRYVDRIDSTRAEIEEAESDRQDRIERLVDHLPKHLKSIGLVAAENISVSDIEDLVAENYDDIDDIENLYLYVWGEAINKFGPFVRVRINHLLEYADFKEPMVLEQERLDKALMDFEEHGINANGINVHIQRQAVTRFAWLLEREPILDDLSKSLKKSRPATGKIDLISVAQDGLDTLQKAYEGLGNLDTEMMTSLDRSHRDSELKRLQFTKKLAELVCDSLNNSSSKTV